MGLAEQGSDIARARAAVTTSARRTVFKPTDLIDARRGMDVAKVSEIVVIMLSPTLVVAAVLYIPRGVRAVWRLARPDGHTVAPIPIEELAADLRRLLRQHETLKQSPEVAMRAKHLRALEGAIADCATDAAHALGLPCPERPARNALPTAQLRELLRSLADAGLVLPPTVGLLAADKRL
jgi:hypothetical protein